MTKQYCRFWANERLSPIPPISLRLKQALKIYVLTCLALFVTGQATGTDYPVSKRWLNHQPVRLLTKTELKKRLPCDPALISHWVQEVGFGSEVLVQYGGYTFVRTDIGDPNGWLTISKSGQTLCRIELALDPDIYLSVKNKLVILSGYDASSVNLEAFDLAEDCNYLGYLEYMLTKGPDPEVLDLLDSHSGSRTCRQP